MVKSKRKIKGGAKMDISGVGCDIIEVGRIKEAWEKPAFRMKYYTEGERAYIERFSEPAQRAAGFFAAKEAVIKALGRPVAMSKIEIIHDGGGRPAALVHGGAADGAELLLSISHCESHAAAFAIAVRRGKDDV